MYLNRITLIGFIGSDAERKAANATNIAIFSLATKPQNGAKQHDVCPESPCTYSPHAAIQRPRARFQRPHHDRGDGRRRFQPMPALRLAASNHGSAVRLLQVAKLLRIDRQ